MNATPGAKSEYSRGSDGSRGGFGAGEGGSVWGSGGRSAGLGGAAGRLILAGAVLGVLLLVVAEFTTLYQAHVAGRPTPLQSELTGSHNSYAMIPLALLALGLAVAVWRTGSGPALLAVGVIGGVALLIAVFGDLPDAHVKGLAGSHRTGYVFATTTPSAGFYMETLGAILLIAACGLGFLMLGSPAAGRARRSAN